MSQLSRASRTPATPVAPTYPNRRISDYVSALQWHMLQAAQPGEPQPHRQRLAIHETQHSRYLSPWSTLSEV